MQGVKMPQEIADFIQANVANRTNKDLAQLVNSQFGTSYSPNAIQVHKYRHGLRMKPKLFPQEIQDFILENYLGTHYMDLAEQINRKFGTSYTDEQVYGYCNYHRLSNGLQHRSSPIGSEIRAGGNLLYVKIKERPDQPYGRDHYVMKHYWVWEQTHGPVPKGFVLTFLDGNTDNCSLDNLCLVSRAECLTMSIRHLRFSNPDLTRSGALIAKLIVATTKSKKELEKKV